MAICMSDYKLLCVSEDPSLDLNSFNFEKHLSHVQCITLNVTMNLYAPYKFSCAAAQSLYPDSNWKAQDKQFLHVVLAGDSTTSVYPSSKSKLSESFSLSFIFLSLRPFFRSL